MQSGSGFEAGRRRPINAAPEHAPQKTSISTVIRCPSCGHRGAWKLADGRRMCKRCRKKYTARKKTSKLSRSQLREIARLFWLLVPAARAAKDLGIGYGTVLKYYNRIRLGIAAEREKELEKLMGEIEVDESYFGGVRKGKRGRGAGGKVPVFGLLKRGGEVRVVFPKDTGQKELMGEIRKNVSPDSIVYSDGYGSYDKLALAGFKHRRVWHAESYVQKGAHINGIENFWGFAKRRLKLYHGGFKNNFKLFIREMEFRFNHRQDDKALEKLIRYLYSGPV